MLVYCIGAAADNAVIIIRLCGTDRWIMISSCSVRRRRNRRECSLCYQKWQSEIPY